MFIVYILQSEVDGSLYYGFTEQRAHDRLLAHNAGQSSYTKKLRPWSLLWFGTFTKKERAQEFERYLKTPSGHAFSRKRLI